MTAAATAEHGDRHVARHLLADGPAVRLLEQPRPASAPATCISGVSRLMCERAAVAAFVDQETTEAAVWE